MLILDFEKQLPNFTLAVRMEACHQVVALFGPSGAGKSLTLQCIAGLVTPDRGLISIGGCTVFDAQNKVNMPPQRRKVGYVFQNYALLPHLTVAGNIEYGIHSLPPVERKRRVREIISTVRLEGQEHRLPGQLSGGQQQRVALARVLVTQPSILLLDEPFAALDSAIKSRLHRELLRLLKELSIPTLLVTHNLEEAYALSDDIAVCAGGRILQCASREEVYNRPRTKTVARFMGVKNFWPGTVLDPQQQGRLEGTLMDGPGFRFWVPGGGFQAGQKVQCCIRPEHVLIVHEDRLPKPGETVLEGWIIEEISYGGHYVLLFRPDLAGSGTAVSPDFHVVISTYHYHRLGMSEKERCRIVLKQGYIHLIEAS